MSEQRSRRFRGFLDVMSEMERMRHLGRLGYDSEMSTSERTHATAWVPSADVVARGQDWVISIEIPGVAPNDIDISVSGGVLTVSGERPRSPEDQTATEYLRERYYGHFRRAMFLPEGVEERRISASFHHGVVVITVPDAVDPSAPTPHRIAIAEG